MQVSPLISVIIPVYNVEKYLNRCLESVLQQTYTNLEIILVDDGSTDNSPKMCDDWAEKDNRIKVIHKINGGLSSARNAGLNHMNGDYVYFIDSDDEIINNTIEILYNVLIEYQCDVTFARFYRIFGEKTVTYQPGFTNEFKLYNEDEFWSSVYELYITDDFEYSINMIISCNKLMNSSIFKDLRYDEGKLNEDEFIIHKIIRRCNKIGFIDTKFYLYYQNSNSIMDKFSQDSIDILEALYYRQEYFANNNKIYCNAAFQQFCNTFYWRYLYLKKNNKAMSKEAKLLYNKCYSITKVFLSNESLKNRILYKSLCINVFLFRILRKLFNLVLFNKGK